MRIIAFIVLLSFLGQCNLLVWKFLEFQEDRIAMTETLCVNVKKPELDCNARCQFISEMEKESKSEHPATQQEESQRLLFFNLFFLVVGFSGKHKERDTAHQPSGKYLFSLKKHSPASVFRPPMLG